MVDEKHYNFVRNISGYTNLGSVTPPPTDSAPSRSILVWFWLLLNFSWRSSALGSNPAFIFSQHSTFNTLETLSVDVNDSWHHKSESEI